MKKYLFTIVGLVVSIASFLVVSCSSPKDLNFQLKGNWKTTVVKQSSLHDNRYTLSFQDTSCIYLNPYAPYSTYAVNKDTLQINEPSWDYTPEGNQLKHIPHYFKIVNLGAEQLELKPLNTEDKELLTQAGRVANGTLIFNKIQTLSDKPFTKLAFYSTVCYGTCPAMYVELDAKGNVIFKAKRFTIEEGWYTGKIAKEDLESITTLINTIALEKLQDNYKADYTDAATKGILIEKDGKKYITSVYGSGKEPLELRILFNILLQAYKKAQLSPSKDLESSLSFKEFYSIKN